MKTTYHLIIFTLVFSAACLNAQNGVQKSLGVSWGLSNIQRQDLIFSPMIHRDWSPVNTVIDYHRTGKAEQHLMAKFASYRASIVEPYEYLSFYNGNETTVPQQFTVLDLNYDLGFPLVKNDRLQLLMGGRSANRLLPSGYSFGNLQSFGYYFSFGLDLWSRLQFHLGNRNRLSATLALPLLAYNARSSYLWHTDPYLMWNYSHNGLKAFGNYLTHGELQSWGKARGIDLDLQYLHTVNDRWDLGLRYLYSYRYNSDPNRFGQLENGIYFSGRYKF